MRTVRFVVLCAALSGVVAACATTSPGVAAAVYGPTGHQFTVAFPSPPRTDPGAQIVSGLPGEIKAYGYAVSPDRDVFATNGPVPPPPTFAAAVVVVKSSSDAAAFVRDASAAPGLKAVTMSGGRGYEFIGSAGSALNQGNKVSDRKATEGIAVLARGTSLFLIISVTAHPAQARSFLASFRIR